MGFNLPDGCTSLPGDDEGPAFWACPVCRARLAGESRRVEMVEDWALYDPEIHQASQAQKDPETGDLKVLEGVYEATFYTCQRCGEEVNDGTVDVVNVDDDLEEIPREDLHSILSKLAVYVANNGDMQAKPQVELAFCELLKLCPDWMPETDQERVRDAINVLMEF